MRIAIKNLKFKSYFKNYRDIDNWHMLLWLLKDICWINNWEMAGTCMIFPNVAIAVWICLKTFYSTGRFFAALSVLLWMVANSLWMLSEFFKWNFFQIALLVFVAGCICSIVAIFYPSFINKNHRVHNHNP